MIFSVASIANRLNGIDSEALDARQVQALVPHMELLGQHPLSGSRCFLAAPARASRAMTRWPGAMPAPLMRWGWIYFNKPKLWE